MSRQCLDYLEIIEDLSEADHVEDMAEAKALPVPGSQPLAHQLDDPRPILRPVLSRQIFADAPADMPAEHDTL